MKGNCGEKPGGVATLTLASLEEEAGPKDSLLLKTASHSAGNGRLPRARRAVQPEDAFAVGIVCPCLYLAEKVDAGIGIASRVVLFGAGVEYSVICGRYRGEGDRYWGELAL